MKHRSHKYVVFWGLAQAWTMDCLWPHGAGFEANAVSPGPQGASGHGVGWGEGEDVVGRVLFAFWNIIWGNADLWPNKPPCKLGISWTFFCATLHPLNCLSVSIVRLMDSIASELMGQFHWDVLELQTKDAPWRSRTRRKTLGPNSNVLNWSEISKSIGKRASDVKTQN